MRKTFDDKVFSGMKVTIALINFTGLKTDCEIDGNEHFNYRDLLIIFRLLEHISATKSERKRFKRKDSSLPINIKEVTFLI